MDSFSACEPCSVANCGRMEEGFDSIMGFAGRDIADIDVLRASSKRIRIRMNGSATIPSENSNCKLPVTRSLTWNLNLARKRSRNLGSSLVEIDAGLFKQADVFYAKLPDRPDSEFEDLILPQSYVAAVKAAYGIELEPHPAWKKKNKWSRRVAAVFHGTGKDWDATMERDVKALVAKQVETGGLATLAPPGRGIIKALANAVEARLIEFET
jgi:hypothetical protein